MSYNKFKTSDSKTRRPGHYSKYQFNMAESSRGRHFLIDSSQNCCPKVFEWDMVRGEVAAKFTGSQFLIGGFARQSMNEML